jgi:hypothetical protein
MNKPIHYILCLLACAVFCSCKKEEKGDFSHWFVATEPFESNDARAENTVSLVTLSSHGTNKPNSFRISFPRSAELQSLPSSGIFKLTRDPKNADQASVDFWYDGTYYLLSKVTTGKMAVKPVNGKAQYILDPCWFVSYNDPTDSVEIRGEFTLP